MQRSPLHPSSRDRRNAAARVIALSMVLVPGLAAQSFDTSPGGLLTQEGPGVANLFGAYPNGRVMFFDGELQNKAGLISEVAVRGNDQPYVLNTNGLGRSWPNLSLDISECDMGSLSATYASNPKTTPTRVFLGSVAFPSRNGPPLVRPDPFGSVTGHMKYPFRSNWVYSGTRAICMDFDFSGGQLANAQTWAQTQQRPYSLDGYVLGNNSASGTQVTHGGSLNSGGCKDVGAAYSFGAYGSLSVTTNSLNAASNPGKVVLGITSLFTAPGAPVFHVFNISGDANGVPFPGVTCNRAHVKLDATTVILARTAGLKSNFSLVQYELAIPFVPALKGQQVWFQGAFADSSTSATHLTNAAQNTVQDMPRTPVRRVLHSTTSQAPSGSGPFDDADWNPVFRYTR